MRLAAKIMLALLGTVVVLTTLASYLSVRAIYAELETQQQQRARELADELQGGLDAAWRERGVDGVLQLLDTLRSQTGRSVQLRWVWFERQAPRDYRPESPPEHWMQIQTGELVSVMGYSGGHRVLHTYLPLPLVHAPWRGGLEITESLAILENHARRTTWLALATIGSVAIACVLTSYLAGLHWIARPLESLTAKTRRIGLGDFSRPLHLSGHDELSQLALAINDMCDRLAEQQAMIRQETEHRAAALEQLRHADRLKTVGRLAAGIAHELGTPLNVIAGRASLITSGKLDEQQLATSAQAIKSEADRITNIVRQLLDFARQRPPHRKQADVRALIRRTVELLQPLAEKQNVSILCDDLPDSLPAWIDEGQVQQVITNMVMNAIQAMPYAGNVRLSARTTAEPLPISDTASPPPSATERTSFVWRVPLPAPPSVHLSCASRLPTTDRESIARCSHTCLSRSSPPKMSDREPDWDSRSPMESCKNMAV